MIKVTVKRKKRRPNMVKAIANERGFFDMSKVRTENQHQSGSYHHNLCVPAVVWEV